MIHSHWRGFRASLAVLAVGVLSGCAAPGPKIHSSTDDAADFARYRTFAFVVPLSTDRANY